MGMLMPKVLLVVVKVGGSDRALILSIVVDVGISNKGSGTEVLSNESLAYGRVVDGGTNGSSTLLVDKTPKRSISLKESLQQKKNPHHLKKQLEDQTHEA